MAVTDFEQVPFGNKPDYVRVAGFKVSGLVTVVKGLDKDTRQVVLYIPALDLSSYGDTEVKANEMLKMAIDSFFEDVIKLSVKERNALLTKLGWQQEKFHNKQFTRDNSEDAQSMADMNIDEKSVEILKYAA